MYGWKLCSCWSVRDSVVFWVFACLRRRRRAAAAATTTQSSSSSNSLSLSLSLSLGSFPFRHAIASQTKWEEEAGNFDPVFSLYFSCRH